MIDELRERLAAEQHEIWAHWMRYLFTQGRHDPLMGEFTIPGDKVNRWMRQMKTSYADLSEKERESDRHQADKIISVLAEGPIVMPLVYEHDRMRIALESIGAKAREALED